MPLLNFKKSNSVKMNSKTDVQTKLLVQEYFHRRIREEKKRTDRTNTPFSMILINLSSAQRAFKNYHQMNKNLLEITFHALNMNSREIDLKGWFDNERVGVLMHATPYSGAITVCNKLIDCMKESLSCSPQNDFDWEDHLSILSYPEILNGSNNPPGKSPRDSSHQNHGRFMQKVDKTTKINHHVKKHLSEEEKLKFFSLEGNHNGFDHKDFYKIDIQKIIKRLVDFTGSLTGIILCFPIFCLISLAIKITSPGPILFKQKRVGLNGKPFTVLKFRTMYNNCDQHIHQEHIKKLAKGEKAIPQNSQNGVFNFKLQNDHRVTKLGQILRSTSLDELPQLFNVLKGEMSLVGPRPYPLYEIVNCATWQYVRHLIKPGITGLAQLYYRHNSNYDDAFRFDVRYVENWSLWLDFSILAKTLPLLISRIGAQ